MSGGVKRSPSSARDTASGSADLMLDPCSPTISMRLRSILRACATFLVVLWVTVSWGTPASGQFASGGSDAPINYIPEGVTRSGNIETAPVRLPVLRRELFRVTAPTTYVRDGNYEEGQYPVELRAELVEANLARAVELIDSDTIEVSMAVLNGATILQINSAQISSPFNLLTVTQLDARFYGQSVKELAEEWREVTETGLREVLEASDRFGEQLLRAGGIVAGMAAISALLLWLRWLLGRRRERLQRREAKQEAALRQAKEAPSPETQVESGRGDWGASEDWQEYLASLRSRFLRRLDYRTSLQRRLRVNRFLRWSIFWMQVLVLYGGAIWITSTVAVWQVGRYWLLGLPIYLLAIVFGINLAIRIGHWLIDRAANSWQDYSFLSLGETKRRALRIATISGVLQDLAAVAFIGLGIVLVLNRIGISTASILAGSAVIGFAVSFGSQSVVKDFINGCFILLEDQFAEGDVVVIGELDGFVESLNLRITQLRNGEGQLITIPNSSITEVKNLTRLWSRVDFTITVAYETPPKAVLDLLRSIATEMYDEPLWQDKMPEPPEVLGIDGISHEGMLLRVWIKTEPLQQWAVGREFRYRVRVAFEAQGIQIGKPQWISYGLGTPQPENGQSGSAERPAPHRS